MIYYMLFQDFAKSTFASGSLLITYHANGFLKLVSVTKIYSWYMTWLFLRYKTEILSI